MAKNQTLADKSKKKKKKVVRLNKQEEALIKQAVEADKKLHAARTRKE